ncbi:MAG TPA: cation:proton antiporter [Ignisphaera sp.]|nr:cation:proton antiporter [Ignisphaera sp.]
MIEWIVFWIGMAMVFIGAICDLIAAIGLLRFPNFFLRIHSATVGIIGGAVVPLIGISLIALVTPQLGSYRIPFAITSFLSAIIIMIVAPIGTHVLAYAAYHTKSPPPQPIAIDLLEKLKKGEER